MCEFATRASNFQGSHLGLRRRIVRDVAQHGRLLTLRPPRAVPRQVSIAILKNAAPSYLSDSIYAPPPSMSCTHNAIIVRHQCRDNPMSLPCSAGRLPCTPPSPRSSQESARLIPEVEIRGGYYIGFTSKANSLPTIGMQAPPHVVVSGG